MIHTVCVRSGCSGRRIGLGVNGGSGVDSGRGRDQGDGFSGGCGQGHALGLERAMGLGSGPGAGAIRTPGQGQPTTVPTYGLHVHLHVRPVLGCACAQAFLPPCLPPFSALAAAIGDAQAVVCATGGGNLLLGGAAAVDEKVV